MGLGALYAVNLPIDSIHLLCTSRTQGESLEQKDVQKQNPSRGAGDSNSRSLNIRHH